MNKQKVIWKKIPTFNYSISNIGEIRNDSTGLILKPKPHPKGYLYTGISKGGKRIPFKIHRLVASAFIPNPDKKKQVNHINGIKSDNRVENLEWNTQFENMQNAIKLFGKKHFVPKKDNSGYNSTSRKEINQFTLEGKFIREWSGAREVERTLKINHQNIVYNLKGKTSHAYGYIWKYKN